MTTRPQRALVTLERLSEDERAYHHRALAELEAAQAAWTSWGRHLAGKYQLGPNDGIDTNGTIHRSDNA